MTAQPTQPANGIRVRHAREALAESKATSIPTEDAAAAQWWVRLESVVESLLEVIDELQSKDSK
jgi:hypothetical protein